MEGGGAGEVKGKQREKERKEGEEKRNRGTKKGVKEKKKEGENPKTEQFRWERKKKGGLKFETQDGGEAAVSVNRTFTTSSSAGIIQNKPVCRGERFITSLTFPSDTQTS